MPYEIRLWHRRTSRNGDVRQGPPLGRLVALMLTLDPDRLTEVSANVGRCVAT